MYLLISTGFCSCASFGLKIIQAPNTRLRDFSTATILVSDHAAENSLASIQKRGKTAPVLDAEKQVVKRMLAKRLMSEKKFTKLYDYEKAGAAGQLFMDVTIREFDYNEADFHYLGTLGIYSNSFKVANLDITSTDQTSNLVINVVFYNAADMRRISEVDLTVNKEHNDGSHEDFGEDKPYKDYVESLVGKALDELMSFMYSYR